MKNILIGVTGGIAAYKAIEIVNALRKKGHSVTVVMTKSAQEFIRPLTFQTLSGNRVITDMFGSEDPSRISHIELAKQADVFAIVPATANIIGKIASGIADDMLSTIALVVRCPSVIAPAMNTLMYENRIVQENIEKLKSRGFTVLDTDNGTLACGDTGKGKLLPWETIVAEIEQFV
ncbi:MAG: bifunctional phosphopantothenoylcysteine decarboxylase/phosphopantothenate--cysteine ligase CoaBC [Dysgonamonadaceae bacterium]|jgi:phosphopantothenoylcysteine decarboxylase/phosphopantothenate--cysteine ligase|nr:bifunctional phosphopantothenoylcysteine decarboxylase/phosphopantothenate--cysteine ligase CoaBC [Dysgonamonadaceae bacterium]